MHDTNELNPPTDSSTSLERVLASNGCSGSAAEAWGTGALSNVGCQKFSACPAAYPVVFCQTTDRGGQRGYYGLTLPAYMQFSAELEP
jgi:hypothetical protein